MNTGWYRFHNEADFTSWLSFYFNSMHYHKKYDGCELFSFGFQKKTASIFKTIRNTGSFFIKRESYLLEQRITEPFRFFNSPKPSQKNIHTSPKPLSLSQKIQSQDDCNVRSTKLHGHDALLASLIDINDLDFYKVRERANCGFFRPDKIKNTSSTEVPDNYVRAKNKP